MIVSDRFGIGAMDNAITTRPGDEKASTPRNILRDRPDMKLPGLERPGLMNAYGVESSRIKMWEDANLGKLGPVYSGADTLTGHQKIIGTFPRKSDVCPFQEKVDAVAGHLREQGYKAGTIEREGLRYVLCDDFVTVVDNLEVDFGMCYSATVPLDHTSFEKEYETGRLVCEVATVGRVIVSGGTGNSMENLWNVEETKDHALIGIASAKSRSYEQEYQCLHLKYKVNKNVQALTILADAGIPVMLIGKVADIVADDKGTSISYVPTEACVKHTIHAFRHMEAGSICTNVRETGLAGHSQSSPVYRQILEAADRGIEELLPLLVEEDALLVMADHGNDPDIRHSKHMWGCVPPLMYRRGAARERLGIRKPLSDAGASVYDYFGIKASRNSTPFMEYSGDQRHVNRKKSLPLIFNHSVLLTVL